MKPPYTLEKFKFDIYWNAFLRRKVTPDDVDLKPVTLIYPQTIAAAARLADLWHGAIHYRRPEYRNDNPKDAA